MFSQFYLQPTSIVPKAAGRCAGELDSPPVGRASRPALLQAPEICINGSPMAAAGRLESDRGAAAAQQRGPSPAPVGQVGLVTLAETAGQPSGAGSADPPEQSMQPPTPDSAALSPAGAAEARALQTSQRAASLASSEASTVHLAGSPDEQVHLLEVPPCRQRSVSFSERGGQLSAAPSHC